MPPANRFTAYAVITLTALLGGGALLVFLVFLIAGPFAVIDLRLSEPQTLLWDAFLSAVFFLQHSGMIRSSFRARPSSAVPARYWPATYSIASGVALGAVVLLWQPSPTLLFDARGLWALPFRAASLLAVAGFVWGVRALGAFDPSGAIAVRSLLGEKQLAPRPPRLIVRGPYLWVRHPLYFVSLVLFWATPSLSADRLLFNLLWTLWMIVGARLEERDLVAQFGEGYCRYQAAVPMLFPWRGPAGRIFESP